jgi:interferon gamma-inducible protein 30
MKFGLFCILVLTTLSAILSKNTPTVIDFYHESLCPGCIEFSTTKLKSLLAQEGSEELAVVNFVPYGNAHEQKSGSTYTWSCQHGAKECRGNLIETCAVNVFPRADAYKFIFCLDENYSGDFDATAKDCLKDSPRFQSDLEICLNSGEKLNQMQHDMAVKTDSLNPPHKWVPWVVVDGTSDSDILDADDLVKYLCSKRSDSSEIALCNDSGLEYLNDVFDSSERFLEQPKTCKRDF